MKMKWLILGLMLLVACGTAQPTVADAVEAGWQREVEPCSNALTWPALYVGVVMERLGDSECAFYYPPGGE